jgi:surface antigen
MKMISLMAAVSLVLATASAAAQTSDAPDPNGYYNQYDKDGYYRDGQYKRYAQQDADRRGAERNFDNGAAPGAYREGDYEDNCRRGNTAGGTLFGALAGGLIGSAASHGDGGAVVGGAILGGLLGNAVSSDMSCDDHPYAMRVYADGLNGDIGHRHEWHHGDDYGYFVPEREFRREGYVCRSFSETTYASGRSNTRSGTACRMHDGNWRFD